MAFHSKKEVHPPSILLRKELCVLRSAFALCPLFLAVTHRPFECLLDCPELQGSHPQPANSATGHRKLSKEATSVGGSGRPRRPSLGSLDVSLGPTQLSSTAQTLYLELTRGLTHHRARSYYPSFQSQKFREPGEGLASLLRSPLLIHRALIP